MAERKLVCCRCGVVLTVKKTSFSYLGHSFSAELPRCEKCGQAYIPLALADGRIVEVETELEDK